ncbi:hypothetical protein Tco_1179988 [Tanacetum coccineum]
MQNEIRCYNCQGEDHLACNCTVKPGKQDDAYLQKQMQIALKEEARIQLTQEEFYFMADAEEQYTELLEPIPESHQVPQNDSNVISEVSSVEQSGGTVEQHPTTPEETRALYDLLYNNLSTEAEKVNSVNCKLTETNADLTIELARYKNQENSGKQITTLNEEISNLNKQLSMEKSNVSSLLKEKKRLKSDFKICEDELLDKQIQLENKIKELDNILVKTEADESLAKHKALELENKRLLRAVVSQDIMSIVQNNSVIDTSNLQTELERTKERFENCIIKKENEYAKLWNDWYKKCEEYKYDKISYDKAYNDMKQKIERLQAQLGDQKGKSKDTICVSNTLDPLTTHIDLQPRTLYRILRVQRIENEAKRGLAVVDQWSAVVHGGPPPLTAVDRWSGGGCGDGHITVEMPRGTTHVVTRGLLIIE